MGNFRLTEIAREDVVEMVSYIALENVDAAITVGDHLEDTFVVLGNNPRAGRERPEVSASIRSFPSGQYIILYKLAEREIMVLRVVHAARDLDEVFKDGL